MWIIYHAYHGLACDYVVRDLPVNNVRTSLYYNMIFTPDTHSCITVESLVKSPSALMIRLLSEPNVKPSDCLYITGCNFSLSISLPSFEILIIALPLAANMKNVSVFGFLSIDYINEYFNPIKILYTL